MKQLIASAKAPIRNAIKVALLGYFHLLKRERLLSLFCLFSLKQMKKYHLIQKFVNVLHKFLQWSSDNFDFFSLTKFFFTILEVFFMSQTFIIQFNYLSILNNPCRGISPTRTVLVYIVIFYVSKYHMDIV